MDFGGPLMPLNGLAEVAGAEFGTGGFVNMEGVPGESPRPFVRGKIPVLDGDPSASVL